MRLTAQVDVIGVIAGAGQKPNVFAPFRTGADAVIFGHDFILPDDAVRRAPPRLMRRYSAAIATSCPLAAMIALTML
jgi:hypothetical protein